MSNARIVKNGFFLLSRTIIVAFISLFTIRELLRVLGENQFGLFNLIFGIVLLFTFLNGALIVSLQRYLGFKVGQNDFNGVKSVFKAGVIIHIFIGLLIVLFMWLFEGLIVGKFLKLEDLNDSVNKLYVLAMINALILCLQSPFVALINIYERMKIIAFLGVFEVILKLIFVYSLFLLPGNYLVTYGFLITVTTFIILILYFIYCYFNFREVFSKSDDSILDFSKDIKNILSFMGWTLIGNFAWMSRVQGVNIVLNVFFGLIANAAYSIFNNLFNSINNLLNSVTNAVKPQIFISFSQNNTQRFNQLIINGTRFFSYGVVIIVMPIIVMSDKVIDFWLGYIPKYTVDFVRLGLIVLLIESLSIFLTIGVQATGKIKKYQIVLGGLLLLNLPLIYFLFNRGFSINSYMYVLMINALTCFFARLYFLNKYVDFNAKVLIIEIFLKLTLVSIIIYFFDFYANYFLDYFNWKDIYQILLIPLILFFNIIIVCVLGLSRPEKSQVNVFVNSKLKLWK